MSKQAYEQAVQVQGLEPFRASRLAAHVLSRNEALVARGMGPLSPVVVRLAAVLMAAQPQLSSPTAMAEAETLATTPGLGQALVRIQNGLDYLSAAGVRHLLAHDGLLLAAARHVVARLAHESAALLESLDRGDDPWNAPSGASEATPKGDADLRSLRSAQA